MRPSRSTRSSRCHHNDSLTLTIGVTRLASALPNDTRRPILRTSVRRARRVAVQRFPRASRSIVVTLVRQINQEATPLQERTFLVAERSPADSALSSRILASGRTATKKPSKAAKCSPRFCSAAHETRRSFCRMTLETQPRTRSSNAATMGGGARDGRARGVTAEFLAQRHRCDPTRAGARTLPATPASAASVST